MNHNFTKKLFVVSLLFVQVLCLHSQEARKYFRKYKSEMKESKYSQAVLTTVAFTHKYTTVQSYTSYVRANCYAGYYANAFYIADRLVSRLPQTRYIYHDRATVLGRMGYAEQALVDLEKAMAKDSNDEMAYNNKGAILIDLGNTSEGIQNLRKAIEINPDLGSAYSNIGDYYYNAGESDSAVFYYKKAIKVKYTSHNIYVSLVRALNGKETEKQKQKYLKHIIKKCTREIPYSGVDYAVYLNRAEAYQLQNRPNEMNADCIEALNRLNNLLVLHPDSPRFLTERARVYCMFGDDESAKKDAREALRYEPRWADARRLLSNYNTL